MNDDTVRSRVPSRLRAWRATPVSAKAWPLLVGGKSAGMTTLRRKAAMSLRGRKRNAPLSG